MAGIAVKANFDNDFEHFRDGDGCVNLRITCCKCKSTESVLMNKRTPTCNQAFANKLFAKTKWKLGSSRKKDVCPDCLSAARKIEQFAPGMSNVPEVTKPARSAKKAVMTEDMLLTEYIKSHMRRNSLGRMVYLTGYSDSRMLADLSQDFPDLTITKVRAIRIANFGEARARRPKQEDKASDAERITDLERQVTNMAIELQSQKRQNVELTRRVDALAEVIEMFVGPRGRRTRNG